jgi:phage-related protein
MSTFSTTPSYGAALKVAPRVRVAQFGDGYSQRVGDGLNNAPRSWSLTFGKRTEAEIDAIEAFLAGEGGTTAFDWTPPRGAAGKWVCKGWDRGLDGFNNERLSATFDEVFEF